MFYLSAIFRPEIAVSKSDMIERKILGSVSSNYVRRFPNSVCRFANSVGKLKNSVGKSRSAIRIVLKTCFIYWQFSVRKSLSASAIRCIRKILNSMSLISVSKFANYDCKFRSAITTVLKTCFIHRQFSVRKLPSSNAIPLIWKILTSVSSFCVGKFANSVGIFANSVGKYQSALTIVLKTYFINRRFPVRILPVVNAIQ